MRENLDFSKLSSKFLIRRLDRRDLPAILALQERHPLYYRFCPPTPCREKILEDMAALPPGETSKDKHYLGFFDGEDLVAILDVITAYPKEDTVFWGFFMVAKERSGKGVGSGLVREALQELKAQGYSSVRLGTMKGNPQSKAFWAKCGFMEMGIEARNDQGVMLVLSKEL